MSFNKLLGIGLMGLFNCYVITGERKKLHDVYKFIEFVLQSLSLGESGEMKAALSNIAQTYSLTYLPKYREAQELE